MSHVNHKLNDWVITIVNVRICTFEYCDKEGGVIFELVSCNNIVNGRGGLCCSHKKILLTGY